MAAFPHTAFSDGSTEKTNDILLISTARSGSVKARLLQQNTKREWSLVIERLTSAEKTTLDAFYEARRNPLDQTFEFTWQGAVYTCIFASPPQWTPRPGSWWALAVTVIEQ